MKKFNSLKEVRNYKDSFITMTMVDVFNKISEHVKIEEMYKYMEDFNTWLGGHTYVVENEVDLKQIPVEINGNLYDNMGKFDVVTKHARYYVFTNITNDAGGDIYFVPITFTNPNIENSFKVSQ
jgi:hypothetical protein